MASVPVNIPRIVPRMRRDFDSPQRDKAKFHLLSAETIDSNDVDAYCRAAEAFEAGRARTPDSVGKAVALLFFQPSTRTRIGFEFGDGRARRDRDRCRRHVGVALECQIR